jgi:hypothetical protein
VTPRRRLSLTFLALAMAGALPVVAQRGDAEAPGGPAPFRFRDVARAAGIDFVLDSGSPLKSFILESLSAGVLLIDFDNDGWLDLYFVNGNSLERFDRRQPGRGNRLYRNLGGGKFLDVTQAAGMRGTGAWGMGGCVGDVDNDGFDDALVTNFGLNDFYRNNGNGTFTNTTVAAGLGAGATWHTGCAFGDYDSDGDLDLYVANYARFSLAAARKGAPYAKLPAGTPIQSPPPTDYGLTPHQFFENVGGGRFVDASERAGVTKTPGGYGLGVVWGDFDNDGDSDVYVANDLSPNHLFRNEGNKVFREIGDASGSAFNVDGRVQASMGVDAADYDNDGDLDVVVTNYSDDRSTLYKNDGNATFVDESERVGLRVSPLMGWGVQFVDLDLDGLQDLVAVNGHLFPEMDKPQVRINRAGQRIESPFVGFHQPALFYRNVGGGVLRQLEMPAGTDAARPRVSRGLAVGDLDNDGRMDLVLSNQDDRPAILMNETPPAGWLMVKLVGTRSNRSAIGARVSITVGGRSQIREVRSGGSYLSQGDLRAHFGLGAARTVDELTIRWPSGQVQRRQAVQANQMLTIREP